MTPTTDQLRGVLQTRPRGKRRARGVERLHNLGLDSDRDGVLLAPDNTGPEGAPLLLALHGAGGGAGQMLDLLTPAAQAHGVALLACDSRASTWDVIRGGYGPDVLFIDNALAAIDDIAFIDPRRIAIGGFSDGASYALSLGLSNGDLFSRILAFSPGFAAPGAQKGLPGIFISHGVHDEVLPIDRCSRKLAPMLEGAGYVVDYFEFDGGHSVPQAAIDRAFSHL